MSVSVALAHDRLLEPLFRGALVAPHVSGAGIDSDGLVCHTINKRPGFIGPRYERPDLETVVDIMATDVVVTRRLPECASLSRARRGEVVELSFRSRRRMMLTARNLGGLECMLTLTYPADYPRDGKTVKYHFQCFRQWLVRQGFSYGFWFLEFQSRGAPHYHVFLPLVGGTLTSGFKAKISLRWAEIVGSADFEKHVRAGTRFERLRFADGASRYAAKYASKMEQKVVPADYRDVGRFWAVWGRSKKLGGSRPSLIVKQVSGVSSQLVDLVRFVRRAYEAKRRTWPGARRWKDRGRRGFVAWGVGPALARAIAWAARPGFGSPPIHFKINSRVALV